MKQVVIPFGLMDGAEDQGDLFPTEPPIPVIDTLKDLPIGHDHGAESLPAGVLASMSDDTSVALFADEAK